VAGILTRLGFAVEAKGDVFTVTVPTWRLDVEREIDLIEEIARIYGYNRFPNTLPGFAGTIRETPTAARDAAVRSTMLALGFNEAISPTFIGRDDAASFSRSKPVELANPVSEDAPLLRNSLVPGMLGMLGWNLNRGVETARLFEHGHIFEMTADTVNERAELCFGATGSAGPVPLGKPRPYSFFDMKGDVETLLRRFQQGTLYFDASSLPAYLHPGRAARAVKDGATVAHFGELHPDVAAARKLRQPVYVAEVRLERLYRHGLRTPQYTPIPRFPAVERDFSFIFSDEVTFERISTAVRDLGIAELRSFAPVEVFRGGAVPAGRYSMLLRASFQSTERTLRDDEVAAWSERIIEALKALGGVLRA
jgi:phenylalanyl-tRNA synthetase beta chain